MANAFASVATSRNEPCPCGSGKRYKHCHGRLQAAPIASVSLAASESAPPAARVQRPAPASALHLEAVTAHQAGLLRRAEALYRKALEVDPRDTESLHMLGVVHFERRRYREALELLWSAAERSGWADVVLRQNLGLVLAKLLTPEANARQETLVAEYGARVRAIAAAPVVRSRVSVVLVVRGDDANVSRSIDSVLSQTYGDVELIVVDVEPAGRKPDAAERYVAGRARPVKTVIAHPQGMARAINDAVRQATGRYVAFLEAGDRFTADRIEKLMGALGRAMPLWGFSRVSYDAEAARREAQRVAPRDFLAHDPVSFTLLSQNVIGTSGNLFVDRALFEAVGGFRDTADDAGWDFSVRAAREVEPVAVGQHLYLRDGGRPDDRTGSVAVARQRRARDLVVDALASGGDARNPFSPYHAANRIVLLRSELRLGRGDRLPIDMLRTLAAHCRTARTETARASRDPRVVGGEKVALVVLGMYRSGTSAFARVLNLCGARLPERLVAARLGLNPTGFWEAEAVTDLDVRLMDHLGTDWNRAEFALPSQGALVDEFVLNAREVVAAEYEDAPLIVLKDPRICVLAPLWHRALREAGYRPAYVVVVRHPIEVAASIETQGDMPLSQGLALWRAYMQRVETFAAAHERDVVHVRYAELLEDWRRVVRRIGSRLRIPLDAGAHADEVDRFLEVGLRRHRADDAQPLHGANGPDSAAIAALHRRLLQRCDRDESIAREG